MVRGRIGWKHSHASQVQPEPKLEDAAALNLSTKSSKDPKSLSISLRRSPVGFPPPPGWIDSQKNSWFHACKAPHITLIHIQSLKKAVEDTGEEIFGYYLCGVIEGRKHIASVV